MRHRPLTTESQLSRPLQALPKQGTTLNGRNSSRKNNFEPSHRPNFGLSRPMGPNETVKNWNQIADGEFRQICLGTLYFGSGRACNGSEALDLSEVQKRFGCPSCGRLNGSGVTSHPPFLNHGACSHRVLSSRNATSTLLVRACFRAECRNRALPPKAHLQNAFGGPAWPGLDWVGQAQLRATSPENTPTRPSLGPTRPDPQRGPVSLHRPAQPLRRENEE
jgi:hypothetical protein